MTELHSTRTVQYQSSFIVTFYLTLFFFYGEKVRIFRRPIFYSLFLNAIFRLRKNYSDIIFYYLLWQICLSERFIKKNLLLRQFFIKAWMTVFFLQRLFYVYFSFKCHFFTRRGDFISLSEEQKKLSEWKTFFI